MSLASTLQARAARIAKAPLKRLLWAFVFYSGLLTLVRLYYRNRLLVITYHGVLSRTHRSYLNRNCVSVDMLRRQIAFMRRHYTLLTLREAVDAIGGRSPLRPYSALITFDDGFRNNYRLALPVLKAAGAPAVVFITTGMLDKPGAIPWVEEVSARIILGDWAHLHLGSHDLRFNVRSFRDKERACEEVKTYLKRATSAERGRLIENIKKQCRLSDRRLAGERFAFLSWYEARGLAEAGVDIGSHTVSHIPLATLTDQELQLETGISRRRIEEEMGRPCFAISYPQGTAESFGEREREVVRSSGYECAFSQIPGYNRQGDDLYSLRRFNVPGGDADFLTFVATLTGARGLLKRLAHLPRYAKSRNS